MSALHTKIVKPIHFAGDILIINFVFLIFCYLFSSEFYNYFSSEFPLLQVITNISWIISIVILRPYKFYRVQTIITIINNTLRLLVLYFVIIEALKGMINSFHHSRELLYFFYATVGVLIIIWRIASAVFFRILRKKGHNFRRVVIAGMNSATKDIVDFFNNHPEHGYRLYKIFDLNKYMGDFNRYFSELKFFCIENKIDEIYCSLSEFNKEQTNLLIEFTDKEVLRLKFIPNSLGFNLDNFKVDFYGYIPVYVFRSIPLDNQFNKIAKRIFDVIFSLFIFVFVFSWLFPIIAIIIKLNSKGPVFFKQKRSGLDNNDFGCYKFRSMYFNEKLDGIQATKGDARITFVGAFLRKTSLDELPQFLNVLLGEMSVVGPRPHPLWLNDKYRDDIEKYMVRHFIKPGITGLAQVKGYRGETTDPAMMERRIKMDVFYMENWSFLLDIKIIFLTVLNILKGEEKAV